MGTNTDLYRSARDQLVALIGDYDKAVEEFSWPRVTGAFNWATDWFDVIARGNHRTALWIVEQDGSEQKVTFAEMADRSNRVATWLDQLGVAKGDRVILMLGNQVELWEAMLAVAKLGAVIMPTTSALGPADLTDRIARGGARFVIANAVDTAKFSRVPGDYGRIVVGEPVPGWHSYSDADAVSPDVPTAGTPQAQTQVHDPLLVYFTSGTTSRPKLVEHTQVSYPVGHMTTMAWIGVRPGDVHLAISSPG
jgi:acetyl-CoA synthetase